VSTVPAGSLLHRAGAQRQRHRLALEHAAQLGVAHFVDADLVLTFEATHFTDALATILFDHLVFDAREDLDVDDRALGAGRHLERRVLHVLGLLTEDGREQLLFGRELGLTLGRDLAHENVARLDLRADAHDATLVEVDQRLFGDVGDFARDFFLPALRVAHVQFELLDVHRRVHVVLHQTLGEHDGVFEVVPVPRHEGHGDVRAKRELPHFRGRPIGEHFAGRDLLAEPHDRTLVDGGVLIGAPVLLEPIPVELAEPRQRTRRIDRAFDRAGIDDDLVGRDGRDDTGARAMMTAPESRATTDSRPVPTSGVRGLRSGTAWRCMFEPMRARLASSCSRNGMSAEAMETSCSGATSM
jgi:hypothetical protein